MANDYDFQKEVPSVGSQKEWNLEQLKALADIVGNYEWQYTGHVAKENDTETHAGPTAQQIAKVPGYENAVRADENGVLTVDIPYTVLALMGTVASLARLVLEDKYVDEKDVRI